MLPHLRSYVLRKLQRVLKAGGYQLQRVTPLDLRGASESARDLVLEHSTELRRDLLVNVPVSLCRNTIGVGLDERHPFVRAVAEGLPEHYEGSLLESYYKQCVPASATDVLGVAQEEAPGFAFASPLAEVKPWSHYDPEVLEALREKWMREQAEYHGTAVDGQGGYTHFGPVTLQKGELELERLRRLVESIGCRGFRRSDERDGDVTGMALLDDFGRWCVQINSGQHRSAVAAGLGFETIPVRIVRAPVKREEVRYWPQVVSGRITSQGALKVFDRVMRGDPPPACRFPAPQGPTIASASR